MSDIEVGKWIRGLIAQDNLHAFYTSSIWLRLREEVIKEHNNECQRCKNRKMYAKATTVHHEQYVRRHPELALSKHYFYQGKQYRNLTPLCDQCHKEIHGPKAKPLTPERW
ncbi:HNH endonuclease [Clostridiales bacterium F-3ap]|uniref:HNH endonuclease n=2 Tax=Anaerotalea alkaliphila TaxID=2662126 RepID=A0A7X5HXL9_9FIRM|nr:HNH endonuclease [Anaerotalea alkaliphila]